MAVILNQIIPMKHIGLRLHPWLFLIWDSGQNVCGEDNSDRTGETGCGNHNIKFRSAHQLTLHFYSSMNVSEILSLFQVIGKEAPVITIDSRGAAWFLSWLWNSRPYLYPCEFANWVYGSFPLWSTIVLWMQRRFMTMFLKVFCAGYCGSMCVLCCY